MSLRCAVYARYSSDQQSPASIDDQIRKCSEYAELHGWSISDKHNYTDSATSGAGIDRPSLQRLLDASGNHSRPFDVVLVDDTSRLFRNLGDSMQFSERLKFLGIRVVSVSQGIDTQNERPMLLTVHGLVDSLYIKELAKKTHRGLEGRVLKGDHAGGRCFGFDNVRADDGKVRIQINETEAAIVRRIFEMAADGGSLKGITKTLNEEHVPPPRKRKGKTDATWCPNAIREMLRNELYIGRLIWNRSKFIKRPGTNKRVRRERPQSEWKVFDKPELRIIDQQLWDRVQERIAFVQEHYNFGNKPGLAPPSLHQPQSADWFHEMRHCGANLIIVSGRRKAQPSPVRLSAKRQSRRLLEQREGACRCP